MGGHVRQRCVRQTVAMCHHGFVLGVGRASVGDGTLRGFPRALLQGQGLAAMAGWLFFLSEPLSVPTTT